MFKMCFFSGENSDTVSRGSGLMMRVRVCTVEGFGLGGQMLQVGESKVTSRISKLLHVQELRHLCKHHRVFKGAYGSVLLNGDSVSDFSGRASVSAAC